MKKFFAAMVAATLFILVASCSSSQDQKSVISVDDEKLLSDISRQKYDDLSDLFDKTKDVPRFTKRQLASLENFGPTAKTCVAYKQPNAQAMKHATLPPGKKVWGKNVGNGWYEVYFRQGAAYLQSSCF